MADKKIVKQLMAIGCQRNDAAAFARAYRKIKAAKREELFPELIAPWMPVRIVRERLDVRELKAVYIADSVDLSMIDTRGHAKEIVKADLADRIADCLIQNNAIKFTERELYNGLFRSTEFMASIRVVMPGEV